MEVCDSGWEFAAGPRKAVDSFLLLGLTNALDHKHMEAKLETSAKLRPLVAGALGGGIAGVVVQPFDVIKTRQQQFFGKNTVYQCVFCVLIVLIILEQRLKQQKRSFKKKALEDFGKELVPL